MTSRSPSQIDQWMRQGLALHQAGRLADAAPIYQRVLARQPRHPAASHLLGLVRLQQGHPAEAVTLLERAVAARPADPQYHCNLGVALNAAAQPERALDSLRRAIRLKPDYAEAHSNCGMALRALGRLAEAAESYRQAVRLRPREAGFHLNLANTLSQLGDTLDAEHGYRQALALRPNYPAAQSGLCQVLAALGRFDEAIAAGEAAIRATPDEAEYHRALGLARWAAGEPAEALVSYRRALALQPQNLELYRLISLLVRRIPGDPEIGAMEALLARGGLAEEQLMHLHFALGQAFEDIGDSRTAFTHYVAGNALQRRRMPYSLAAAEAEAEALLRQFGQAPAPAPLAATGPGSPIFIVGLPRSGKSTLEGMLGRHPSVHPGGELPLFGRLVGELRKTYGFDHDAGAVAGLPPAAIASLGAAYREQAARLAPGGTRLVDTMPLNFWHLGFIRLALPDARIIHCTREPFAHCVAIFQKYFAMPGFGFSSELGDIAGYHRICRRLMAHWRRRDPEGILELDPGTLRDDPEGALREVLGFCGLPWEPACAAPYESEPRLGETTPPMPDECHTRLAPYRPLLAPLLEP